jgi:hypothetical protein
MAGTSVSFGVLLLDLLALHIASLISWDGLAKTLIFKIAWIIICSIIKSDELPVSETLFCLAVAKIHHIYQSYFRVCSYLPSSNKPKFYALLLWR